MDNKGIDFAAMTHKAVKVVTSPAGFFREMPKTGGFGEPLVFMIVMGVVAGLVNAVLSIVGLHIGVGVGTAMASIIIYPLVGAVLGFIGAALAFVIWKLMGSQESYETAYRCIAYLAALWPITTAINVIPYIGMLIVIVIWVYFYVVASIEVHKITSQRAWLVFGILGVILIVLGIGAGMAQRAYVEQYQKQLEQSTREMRKNSEEARKSLEEMQKRLEKK